MKYTYISPDKTILHVLSQQSYTLLMMVDGIFAYHSLNSLYLSRYFFLLLRLRENQFIYLLDQFVSNKV